MNRLLALSVCLTALALSSCNSPNSEKAREDIHKTGVKVEQDAKQLGRNIDHAVGTDSRSASEKLAEGQAKLEAASDKASVKLTEASLEAQVKTNLASDAGLSTITGINVSATRTGVITLTGNVASQAQKDAADHAAAKVDGVTRVENHITVGQ